MPIREFTCGHCHTEFEELVFGSALPPCPNCGSLEVIPLMSCCCVRTGHSEDHVDARATATNSKSGCCGCSGGNCASCH